GSQRRGFAYMRHWDGRRWHTVASPGSTATIQLHAVATATRTQTAWAVGALGPRRHPSDGHGFALRWEGGRWRRVHVPLVAGELYDVTAHGDGLWVVGADERDGALSMRRADGRWHVVRPPGTDAPLTVVASQPRGDVWAAIYDDIYRRRDGRWRRVRTMEHAALIDLTFTSPTEAWVVGGGESGGEWYVPFSMRRVRSSWSVVPLPAVEDASAIVAVDGTPHDVWAVGNPIGYGGPSTAYHYC
ncbi:MAG TPA: hypothetical protein VF235_07400, partial [Actinomycetota bacterium]